MAYIRPKVKPDGPYGQPELSYEGVGVNHQWGKIRTFGGKLVENIVQAIARDCLADAMLRLNEMGHRLVMHVHDEVITEALEDSDHLAEVNSVLGQPIPWAPGLPLNADGFTSLYYRKD